MDEILTNNGKMKPYHLSADGKTFWVQGSKDKGKVWLCIDSDFEDIKQDPISKKVFITAIKMSKNNIKVLIEELQELIKNNYG